MNKSEVVASISNKTGMGADVCSTVMDGLEHISGNILLSRLRGVKLDESAAAAEVAQKSGVSLEDCKTILSAFEETFGEALSNKFRFFQK